MDKRRNNNFRRYSRPAGRQRDPRKWEVASGATARKRKKPDNPSAYRKFLVIAVIIAVLAAAYFLFGRKTVDHYIEASKFDACRERLRIVRDALVKTKIDNPTLTPGNIYKFMNKQTNIGAEQWVGEKCLGSDAKPWDIDTQVRLPKNTEYIVHGMAKTKNKCVIRITSDRIWPLTYEGCGKPPPPPPPAGQTF
jgi:hypothetical protein